MTASRPIVAFTVVCLLAGASSRAFAQSGMAGMDHSKHRMGPEIVIPKGALYTKADVEFMQGMIAHHAQAVVMSRLARSRRANPHVLKLSSKIDRALAACLEPAVGRNQTLFRVNAERKLPRKPARNLAKPIRLFQRQRANYEPRQARIEQALDRRFVANTAA